MPVQVATAHTEVPIGAAWTQPGTRIWGACYEHPQTQRCTGRETLPHRPVPIGRRVQQTANHEPRAERVPHGALVEEALLPRSPVRGLAAKVVRLDLLADASPMLDIIGRVHTEQQNPRGAKDPVDLCEDSYRRAPWE